MFLHHNRIFYNIKCHLACLISMLFIGQVFAQPAKVDSIQKLLSAEHADSNRVNLMWKMADYMSWYNPDSGLIAAQQALFLAKQIDYKEGQSRSLGILANTFMKTGNYPRSLELNIEKLKLEEKRNKPRNLASVFMNIAIVYVMQEEYLKALEYYAKSDSVIRLHKVTDFDYHIAINKGDVYNRINQSDSAYKYFITSLNVAQKLDDDDLVGISLTGLGHSNLKMGHMQESHDNYLSAITLLKKVNDDDILCEALLGIANYYKTEKINDSAIYYATQSLLTAQHGGFMSHELNAADFLTVIYQKLNRYDSAFVYQSKVRALNDSLNSKNKIRQSQIISGNEQLRQLEIAENKKIAAKQRKQQLQMLFIGIFIPGLFIFTLLLSRISIPVRVVKIMGIMSLLFLFEYLTLLLHPRVAELTHHTPVYEILIFVSLAAVLIPAHHRIEHWLLLKLSASPPKNRVNQLK